MTPAPLTFEDVAGVAVCASVTFGAELPEDPWGWYLVLNADTVTTYDGVHVPYRVALMPEDYARVCASDPAAPEVAELLQVLADQAETMANHAEALGTTAVELYGTGWVHAWPPPDLEDYAARASLWFGQPRADDPEWQPSGYCLVPDLLRPAELPGGTTVPVLVFVPGPSVQLIESPGLMARFRELVRPQLEEVFRELLELLHLAAMDDRCPESVGDRLRDALGLDAAGFAALLGHIRDAAEGVNR
jgi:hypothetical protein